MAEGNLPLKTLPVQRGEYAELDEQLESVADSQHEAARIDEPVQAVQQRLAFRVGKMQPALCRSLCRPEIVAIKESAGENKELDVYKRQSTSRPFCFELSHSLIR